MKNNGWIKIHRDLTGHWLWNDEKFTKGQAWIDLILNANHSDNKTLIKGQLVEIKRGEQIRSQVTLSELWKWDRKTVRRFLKVLENDKMITQHSTHLTTVITICNYNEYQETTKDSPQPNPHAKGQARPKCRDTNKNVKNDKNNNKHRELVVPEWINQAIWQDFVSNRKTLKSPLTDLAATRIISSLEKFRQAGHDPNQILNKSIENGWKGVFEPKGGNNERDQPSRAKRFSDKLDEIARKDIEENGFTESLDNRVI